MRAVSVALDAPVDLDDVCRGDGLLFVRDGVGVAGRDVVVRSDDPGVLAGITHDDRAGGARLIAFATLPFDPTGGPSIVVARRTVERRADGTAVLTVVDEDEPDLGAAIAEVTEPVAAARRGRRGLRRAAAEPGAALPRGGGRGARGGA